MRTSACLIVHAMKDEGSVCLAFEYSVPRAVKEKSRVDITDPPHLPCRNKNSFKVAESMPNEDKSSSERPGPKVKLNA